MKKTEFNYHRFHVVGVANNGTYPEQAMMLSLEVLKSVGFP